MSPRLLHPIGAAVLFGMISLFCSTPPAALGGEQDGRLDIFFIDVEGGAASLIVSPKGQSILIDSGYPDNGGRDLNRILHVVRDVARLKHIDHAIVTHWHRDHYGNHAALASQIQILNFWDRGIPDALAEDANFPTQIAQYRAATQNQSHVLKAGDDFSLDGSLPLKVRVVAASRQVIPNTGEPNPHAALHQEKPVDNSDNAASVALLMEFGKFRYLCCGDLTWNVEAQLVTPNNPLGQVDLFMVTHHGLPVSNNPVLVLAVDPVVSVMCNGPTKGGDPAVLETLGKVKSRKALFQLHRNVKLPPEAQTPAEFIANSEPTVNCAGQWVKASVATDGNAYTVQIGPEGTKHEYKCRFAP